MIKLGKKLLITEKPSVAMEFAKALKITTNRRNGYLESEKWIITWCVGHLVSMSDPEKYDENLIEPNYHYSKDSNHNRQYYDHFDIPPVQNNS